MTTIRAFDGETLLWTIEGAEVAPMPGQVSDLYVLAGHKVDAPVPVFFPPFPGRVISAGDHGADVQAWQDRLLHLGFEGGSSSGTQDDHWVTATRTFQSAQGLDPTGQVDEKTWLAAFHKFAGDR